MTCAQKWKAPGVCWSERGWKGEGALPLSELARCARSGPGLSRKSAAGWRLQEPATSRTHLARHGSYSDPPAHVPHEGRDEDLPRGQRCPGFTVCTSCCAQCSVLFECVRRHMARPAPLPPSSLARPACSAILARTATQQAPPMYAHTHPPTHQTHIDKPSAQTAP